MKKRSNNVFVLKAFLAFILIILSLSNLFAQNFQRDLFFQPDYKFRDVLCQPWENRIGTITNVIAAENNTVIIVGGYKNPYDSSLPSGIIKLSVLGELETGFHYYSHFQFGIRAQRFGDFAYIYNAGRVGRFELESGNWDQGFEAMVDSIEWDGLGAESIGFLDDGSFFAGGGFVIDTGMANIYPNLIKVKENGLFDTSFHHDASYAVMHILKYDSTRFIISGLFDYYDGVYTPNTARIFNDGTLDTSYHNIFIDYPWPLYVQDDGKIIMGGSFDIIDCPYHLGMVRLNCDGSLDSTFNNFNNVQPAGGLSNQYRAGVSDICLTNQGKYLLTGEFPNYQGYQRGSVALTDINGYLDTTVFTGTGFDACDDCYGDPFVYDIEPAFSGRYYLAGCFTGYNGELVEPIIRLYDAGFSIEEEKKVVTVSVSPNPFNKQVNFSWTFPNLLTSFSLEIYDIMGKPYLKETLHDSTGTFIWKAEYLSPGQYIYRFTSDKQTITEGIILKQ